MCSSLFLTILYFTVLAFANPAPVSPDSPPGVQYRASFGTGNTTGALLFSSFRGYVLCLGQVGGFPQTGGPFEYGIHEKLVPSDRDCTKTLGLLDPYHGVPDAPTPAEYKVGDLSGKHGVISETILIAFFIDNYISLNPENPAFIGNLSFGVRDHNDVRLACTNLEKLSELESLPKEVEDEAEKLIQKIAKSEAAKVVELANNII